MIILNVYGGLGNQMLGYAYAKALAEEYGEEMRLNTVWIGINQLLTNFKHVLCREKREHYKVRLYNFECGKNLRKMSFFPGLCHGLKLELFLIWQIFFKKEKNLHGKEAFERLSSKGYFISNDHYTYYNHQTCTKKYKYVQGVFTAQKYFERVIPQLRKDFQPLNAIAGNNLEMLEKIQSVNSVCVHIRRGDYLSNPFYSSLKVCTDKYYFDAISYIERNVSKPVFFVFSNNSQELEWIKENYKFLPKESIYVDLNNCDFEELRLMYSCKNFVISNSSFSWWAAILSNNDSKVICAPPVWDLNYKPPCDSFAEMTQIDTD